VLHPGASGVLRRGVSVAWPKIPYTGGAWAEWESAARAEAYPRLLAGDGPYLFAGEHMSNINGWQEGAVRSAQFALAQIGERMRAGP
jgi:monoamine oxidase